MTGNKAYLTEYQDFNGGPVAFGGNKGQISGKDTECLVLSPDFKLPNENQVLLRVSRQNNMYSFNLENIVPSRGLSCLIAKATAEAVSTTCFVLNRVLVTKRQNKTPYELITGKIPIISYIRPFGCHVTILNTIDHLGKFEEKSNEGFLLGYSLNRKAFMVYNLETKRVEENLHINFLENKPNVAGKGPNWLFDLDYLTDSMNYQAVTAENKANKTASPKEANNSAEAKNENEKLIGDTGSKTNEEPVDQEDQAFLEELASLRRQEKEADDAAKSLRKTFAKINTANTPINIASTPINTASLSKNVNAGGPSYLDLSAYVNQDDSQIPSLKDIYKVPNDEIFTSASYDDEGAVADFTNLKSTVNVSPIPQSRIHSIHLTTKILGDPTSAVQIRSKVNKSSRAYAFVKQKEEGIFIGQDKYVVEILKKFDFMSVKTASTLIKTKKPLVKDAEAADVDAYLYRSMIGSLMYLTASRPDIMYAVCVCSRFEVTLKTSHLQAVKRIFRRLILWQCKKQTIVATSTTEVEYVAAASCCGHHFIRDAYEKKLIQVLKIHTNDNVADLLTKAFDVSRCGFSKNEKFGSMYPNKGRKRLKQEQILQKSKETALGKDFSNPLMADKFAQNYMVINAPCYCNEALAIPDQTATGKETSNSFMADGLLKNVKDAKVSNEFKFIKEQIRVIKCLNTSSKVMSTATHPIIILSDFDVEEAFSSTNTPNYTPASPNYSLASPGNTASDFETKSGPLEDPFKDHSASLSISLFHDDSYIKVMQAYNATSNELPILPPQAPIAPPTVLPPSPVLPLSPLFDPQDFFFLGEILPPQKRAHFLSSSSIDSSTPL
nr:hypothetical protein [Tanacetum cinerariifolium]